MNGNDEKQIRIERGLENIKIDKSEYMEEVNVVDLNITCLMFEREIRELERIIKVYEEKIETIDLENNYLKNKFTEILNEDKNIQNSV